MCVVFYFAIYLLSKCMLCVLAVFDGNYTLTPSGPIRREEVPGEWFGSEQKSVKRSWSDFLKSDVADYAELMLSPLTNQAVEH